MSHEKKSTHVFIFLLGLLMSLNVFSQLPTAQTVAGQMKVGWNLGNTLEAICGENAWGNPTTSQTLINAVKAAGFNTVRIPCAWDCHATNGVIDANWLARVKTVVDYCVNNQMYAIINIHWDGGWLENNCTTSAQSAVNAKQQNYWTQIANYFKNYNERLLFASANEPAVSDATGMSVLLSYHQTFVNAVRATGGNNSSRTLIIQGPSTNIDNTNTLMNTLPTDPIANRLMVEVHYYTPWNYCGLTADASWGSMFYYWGNGYHSTIEPSRNATWGEESEVERALGLMKTKYVDKGIPVLIGEFGVIKRTNPSDMPVHVASREYFNKYVVSSAKSKGMVPVYWDNGASDFGLFNRSTGAATDQGVINAIMQGAGGGGSTNTYVTLKNRATGLMIDGIGRTGNGSNCGQWSNSGSYNQQWTIETAGTYVTLKTALRDYISMVCTAVPMVPLQGNIVLVAVMHNTGQRKRPAVMLSLKTRPPDYTSTGWAQLQTAQIWVNGARVTVITSNGHKLLLEVDEPLQILRRSTNRYRTGSCYIPIHLNQS